MGYNAKTQRIITECGTIKRLLSNTGLVLSGWSSVDDFTAIDEHGKPHQFSKPHVDLLRRLYALENPS